MEATRGHRQGHPLSPLLFVIVMDYLHRVLQKLKHKPNFSFHSKCEKMVIINLNFADHLFLFSRGDSQSVEMVMQAFEEFSKSTGLKVNPTKCKVFFGNVGSDEKRSIQGFTNFSEGALPFRYLGIPQTSRKLSVIHYMSLVEKILVRINQWSLRLLSFAGRIQLINSVLFALTNYWLQCQPLPKKVIKKINTVLNFPLAWQG